MMHVLEDFSCSPLFQSHTHNHLQSLKFKQADAVLPLQEIAFPSTGLALRGFLWYLY